MAAQRRHRGFTLHTQVSSLSSPQPALLEALGLECIRGDRLLFSDLNLSLQAGRLLQVEGPNGAGKTSLLRILCGLSTPSQGEVRWCGEPIHKVREEFFAEVSYLGHHHGVKGDLTARENVRIANELSKARSVAVVQDVLQRVGLENFSDVPARTLSLGQQRRVALGRLLATQTQLWVLDEPLAALDIKGVELVEKMLSEHLLQGGMAVVSTHQPLSVQHAHVIHLNLA